MVRTPNVRRAQHAFPFPQRRRRNRVAAALLAFGAVVLAAPRIASAFCGFYISGADAKLFNNATQVVMMREGTRTVLSMQNNYEGPPESFAMIVPVPVVLQKENVKTLPKELFDKIDRLTAPRLVEYWEQDPCRGPSFDGDFGSINLMAASSRGAGSGGGGKDLGVTVEARFDVGEYDVVILSAKDSGGLDTWLKQEKYKIPSGAEPYLRPYVAAGSKFFVAKVDPKRVTFEKGQAALSPLRFHYDSNDFSLPVRLGLINSRGTQDLIVNILASDRFEAANYPNVTIPTNLDLAEGSKEHFGRFYAALFDRTLEKNPKSVVTEYSWDASTCDPCPGPAMAMEDFATLGADALPSAGPPKDPQVAVDAVTGTGAPTTRDLVSRRFKRRIDECWATANGTTAPPSNGLYGGGYYPPPTPTASAVPLVNRKPKSGHVDVKLAWGAEGKLKEVAITRNETDDKEVAECVKKAFEGGVMPAEEVSMTASYLLNLKPQLNYKQWTITRLHARYSREALGEDIVFKTAKPITGGREVRDAKNNLEHGSITTSSSNNFQGRYAIRHSWVGPIDCKEPKRGVWGGPWHDLRMQSNQPATAEKTAFVPRGGVTLTSFVRTDVPELGVQAGKGPLPLTAVAPATSASPSDPPPATSPPSSASPASSSKGGCGSCASANAHATTTGSTPIDLMGVLGGGLALLLLRRHRRRVRIVRA